MKMLCVLLIVWGWMTAAKESCNAVPKFRDIAKTKGSLKPQRKNSATFGKDHSTTAANVETLFGATGDFDCGDLWGQAQLTETDHHITTAGHLWVGQLDCKPRKYNEPCKFIVNVEGKRREFKVKGQTAIGCELGSPDSDKNDWAVLELAERVPESVTPYKTDKRVTNAIVAGKELISVGKSRDVKLKGMAGLKMSDYPRHFTDCVPTEVRRLFTGDDPDIFTTNCPTNNMSSGGSLIDLSSGTPILVGTEVGTLEADKAHFFVPVSGKLASTLEALRPAEK